MASIGLASFRVGVLFISGLESLLLIQIAPFGAETGHRVGVRSAECLFPNRCFADEATNKGGSWNSMSPQSSQRGWQQVIAMSGFRADQRDQS